jgi:hypothetical protein
LEESELEGAGPRGACFRPYLGRRCRQCRRGCRYRPCSQPRRCRRCLRYRPCRRCSRSRRCRSRLCCPDRVPAGPRRRLRRQAGLHWDRSRRPSYLCLGCCPSPVEWSRPAGWSGPMADLQLRASPYRGWSRAAPAAEARGPSALSSSLGARAPARDGEPRRGTPRELAWKRLQWLRPAERPRRLLRLRPVRLRAPRRRPSVKAGCPRLRPSVGRARAARRSPKARPRAAARTRPARTGCVRAVSRVAREYAVVVGCTSAASFVRPPQASVGG